jgi:hypothetical protein
MAANTNPIFPVAPLMGIASLIAAAAITNHARIVGTAGLAQLTPTTVNGARIDQITVTGKANTAAGAVDIWIYDGVNSHYFTSIDLTANTVSTTNDPLSVAKTFTTLVLPPTYQLFVSETIQQDVTVFAHGGSY